jgi:hypothetical protein
MSKRGKGKSTPKKRTVDWDSVLRVDSVLNLRTDMFDHKSKTVKKNIKKPVANKKPVGRAPKRASNVVKKKADRKPGPAGGNMNFIRSDRSKDVRNAQGDSVKDSFEGMVSCDSCSVDFYWSCLVKNAITGKLEHNMTRDLVWKIKKYGTGRPIVGCVAWLSNKVILNALKGASGLAIVVNRENYDVWGNGCVKNVYPTLPRFKNPMHKEFEHLGGPLTAVETHKKTGKSSFHPIRAFGTNSTFSGSRKRKRGKGVDNSNEDVSSGTGGLEHCKYLIFFEKGGVMMEEIKRKSPQDYAFLVKEFAKKDGGSGWNPDFYYPYRVWTGSMNMTGKSKEHHENGMWCTGFKMAFGFFNDFSWTYINTTSVFSKSKSTTPSINEKKKTTKRHKKKRKTG